MPTNKKRVPVALLIAEDVVAVYDAEAEREGLSRSDVMRRVLLRYIRQAKTETATPPRAA
jgi:hypothetical protein